MRMTTIRGFAGVLAGFGLLFAGSDARAQYRTLQNNPPPGRTFTLSTGGELFIPDSFTLQNGQADLLVHFHGAPFVVKQNLAEAKWNAVIVNYTVNGFSSAYSIPFSNTALFQRMIDEALTKLRAAGFPTAAWGRIVLSSFSAGYGAIREILKVPAYVDRVAAISLADSLHAGLDASGKPDGALAPFRAWAKLAAEGKKILWSTHTSILTYTYANTTQCNNDLIATVGATSVPVSEINAWGEVMYRRADLGGFHVRGYTGTTANDHCRQLWNQAEFYAKVAAELGGATTGSTGGTDGTTTTTSSFSVKVTVSALNVRSGPGTGYSLLGGLLGGTVVEVKEVSGAWYRIDYNGKAGWIYAACTVRVALETALFSVKITAAALNVRSGPGTGYTVIGSLSSGMVVAVYEERSGWYRIIYNGAPAWISATYAVKA